MDEEGVNYATVRLKKKPSSGEHLRVEVEDITPCLCIYSMMQQNDSKMVTSMVKNGNLRCNILNKEPLKIN